MAVSCLASHPGLDAKRFAGYLVIIAALLLGIAPPSPANAAGPQPECRAMSGLDVCGRFLQEWSKYGSDQADVYVNGLPITAARPEISLNDGKTYDTQWFERSRYEAHPENKAPYDVLLGLLGASLVEGRGVVDPYTKKVRNPADQPFVGIDKPSDADGTTKMWFPETRHSVSGKILQYWQRYGGLAQFGFPLSEQFQEVSATDGKSYTVQYFERNRFEVHPEKQAPYEVELGLLGVQQYQLSPVAADQLPIAPPKGMTSKKDTVIIASSKEPTDLVFDSIGSTALSNGLLDVQGVGLDQRQSLFPWALWYVPTLENGGAYYTGTGDDRQLVVKSKIRPGIKYSDGVELTSNDFAFCYEYLLRPDSKSDKSGLLEMANVDNPDKYTVILRYRSYRQAKELYDSVPDKQDYEFLKYSIDHHSPVIDVGYYNFIQFLPEHILKEVPAGQLGDSDYAHAGYVGAGPYKVESWTSGQQMVLVQNDNYTLTAKPLIKRIIIRFIPDQAEVIRELRSGDIDAAFSNVFTAPVPELDTLEPNVLVDQTEGNVWEHVDFHFTYPPFKEHAVREAIITAIDRQKLVDRAYLGKARVLNTVAPYTQWWSLDNPDFARHYPEVAAQWKLPIYSYDPDKANRLLDAAGWVRGADGVRAKGGVKLEFELATTNHPVRETVTHLIQSDLQAVGIKADLKYYASDEYFGWNGVIDRGQCQMCEYAWIENPYVGISMFTSSAIPTAQSPEGGNAQQYVNPRVDQLADLMLSDPDRHVVAPYAAEGQVILMTDIATVPLFSKTVYTVHAAALRDFDPDYLGDLWWSSPRWYFDK